MEGKTPFCFLEYERVWNILLTMTGKASIIVLIHATLCTDTFQATI